MNSIMKVIGWPLGWIMWLMYQITSNYGVALILFTLAAKILMLPLSINQQKSTVKMQLIQPKINELQAKYKNNPEKLNQEIQALYDRENYSMMSGCLPMLIQFPVLFGLIDVVYKPLSHLLRLGSDVVTSLGEIITANGITATGYTQELVILGSVKDFPEWFASISPEIITQISSIDMSFLGLNLATIPNAVIKLTQPGTWLNPLILIPLLSGATALLTSLQSIRNAGEGGAQMRTMMLMMPLMSLAFTFTVPAGVGIYWIVNNLLSAVQARIMNKFWNPKEMAAKMKADEEERKIREREEKIEAKKRAKEQGVDIDETALSQKEQNRIKLAEARRRNAEKYGDTYVEVTDEDLK